MAYSLLGIFDVKMPLIYSEGKDKALRRLREEIDKASKGKFFLFFFFFFFFRCEYSSRINAYLGIKKLLTSSGFKREDFSVAFSLSNVYDVQHFVARKPELIEIHKALSGDGSRRAVVLHGLGGIGKTQLSIAYAKRHKDSYSAIFWLKSRTRIL
jgi:hypothetical protein